MAFDPTTAKEDQEFNPSSATPSPEGAAFNPDSAKEWRIPFDALIQIESSGNHWSKINPKEPVISSANAIGISQLKLPTARDAAKMAGVPFDVKKLKYDPEYNRQLGEAYYNNLYEQFGGDNYKAAAAYNAGPTRIKNLIDTFGDDWYNHLPDETENYLVKLGFTGIKGKSPQAKPQAANANDAQNFELTAPPVLDYREMLTSGGIGGAAMTGISLIPQVRGVAGAIRAGEAILPALGGNLSLGEAVKAGAKGFTEGVISTGAGQVYQYGKPENAANDLTRMGIEFATGGAYEPGVKLIKGASSIIDKVLPDFVSQFVTKPVKLFDTAASELNRAKVMQSSFGPASKRAGTSTDVFTEGTRTAQRKELNDVYNIAVPKGVAPQDFLRGKFSSSINELEKQGITFRNSPQYQQLMMDLEGVNAPKAVKDGIKRIANLQGSSIPEAASSFEKNILNLIQQSKGDFKVQDLEKLSSELLRKHFNGFLEANTGVPYYNLLKKAEADDFVATARDSLPTLVANGFAKNEATDFALKHIKRSKNGVEDLKLTVRSYLKNIPNDEQLLKQWNDLEYMLRETKAMPFEDIMSIKRQVNKARSMTGKAKVAATLIAKDALVTGLSTETSRKMENKPAPTITEMFL